MPPSQTIYPAQTLNAIRKKNRAPNGPVEVRELRTRPEWVPAVAEWLHREWFQDSGTSLVELQQRLETQARERTIPRAFVASVGGQPVGAFSMTEATDPITGFPMLCLANVFVPKPWRRRGIGRHLCRAAIDEARRLHIPQLGLFTIDHTSFYESLGWQQRCSVPVVSNGTSGQKIFMRRDIDAEFPPANPVEPHFGEGKFTLDGDAEGFVVSKKLQ